MEIEKNILETFNSRFNRIKMSIGKHYELALAYQMFEVDPHALDEFREDNILLNFEPGCPGYDDLVSDARNSYNIVCSELEEISTMFGTYPICYFQAEDLNISLYSHDDLISKDNSVTYIELMNWINWAYIEIIKTLETASILKIKNSYPNYGRYDAYDLEGDIFIENMGDGRYFSKNGTEYALITLDGYKIGFFEK